MTTAARFAYHAVRGDGSVERGTLDAATVADARATLERRAMLALEITPVDALRRRSALPPADLALGLRVLADLIEAGLPMTRALHTLSELAPESWRAVLPDLRESVREGKSLAAALRDAPVEIPALVIGMTMAGEAAGDLGAAVRRAADVTEAGAETRAAVRAALAYPALLAVAGTGAIAIMVGVVIPRFALILGDLGQTLPRSTRFVMEASLALRSAFLPFITAVTVAAVLARAWMATPDGRRRAHTLLLGVPLIGTVRRAAGAARTAFTLAALLETGVPFRAAMRLAGRAGGDAALEHRLSQAAERIEAGQPIARALADTESATPLVVRLVQAGEESGRLAGMLRHAAKLEQQRAERITKASVRLIEPALVLVFAGVVAIVAAALLQAVYAVRPTP